MGGPRAKDAPISTRFYGPHRGVNNRETSSAKGEFLHLMNGRTTRGAIRKRLGYDHYGAAAMFTDRHQYSGGLFPETNPATSPPVFTNYRDRPYEVIGHMLFPYTPSGGGATQNVLVRALRIDEPYNSGGPIITSQFWLNGGWVHSLWTEQIRAQTPHPDYCFIQGKFYFWTGLGPVYGNDAGTAYGVEGDDILENEETNVCLIGKLPHPRCVEIINDGQPVFGGVHPSSDLYTLNRPMESPIGLSAAAFSTVIGTATAATHYFAVTALKKSDRGVGWVETALKPAGASEANVAIGATQNAARIGWQARASAEKYRVYHGLASGVYTEYWETPSSLFEYVGGPGTSGSPPATSHAGLKQVLLGDDCESTLYYFLPLTYLHPVQWCLRADNVLPLPRRDMGKITKCVWAFGGLVVFRERGIQYVTGQPYDGSAKVRDISGAIGSESYESIRLCSDGVIRFLSRTGPYELRGADQSLLVSIARGIEEYFRGASVTGVDILTINKFTLDTAHAQDDGNTREYKLWCDMSLPNHAQRSEPNAICLVYTYKTQGELRPGEASGYWVFDGKSGYVINGGDNDGTVNKTERGYAFRSSAMLDDGTGLKRLYMGGYDGYTHVVNDNFRDSVESDVLCTGVSEASFNVLLDNFPGMVALNDLVGATVEVIDDRTVAERAASGNMPANRCPNGTRVTIDQHTDSILWDCGDVAANTKHAGVTETQDTDAIRGSYSGKFTCGAGIVLTEYLMRKVVSATNMEAADRLSFWIKCDNNVDLDALRVALYNGAGALLDTISVPKIDASQWTRMMLPPAGALTGVARIDVIYQTAINGGSFNLWLDEFQVMSKRTAFFHVTPGFVDETGASITLRDGALIRVFWPIATRVVPVPFGLESMDRNKLWYGMNIGMQRDGVQTVNVAYSANAQGFSKERVIFTLGSSPDGTFVSEEEWSPYWTTAPYLGHKEYAPEPLIFHTTNIGPVLWVVFEEKSDLQFTMLGWYLYHLWLEQVVS